MAPALLSAPTSLADAQWFFSPKELARPPSVRADKQPLTLEKERHARAKAVRRLWEIKNAIQLPTLVIGTASTFVHRFYMRETIQQFPPEVTAAAACFLSSKVEEKPRSLRTILGCALEAERHNGMIQMHKGRVNADENDRTFINFKRAVLHCEETMLRALCFDLTVRLPYPAVTNGAKRIWKGDAEIGEQVARAAWVVVNDTLPTTTVLVHRPNVIAAAAIVIACEKLAIPLPTPKKAGGESSRGAGGLDQDAEEGEEHEEEPYWLELFDVMVEEVQDAVKMILEVYKRALDPFVFEEAAKFAPKALAAASRIEPTPIPSDDPVPTPSTSAVEPTLPSAEPPLDALTPPAVQPPAPEPPVTFTNDLSDLFPVPGLAAPPALAYPPQPPPPAAPFPLPEPTVTSDVPVFPRPPAPLPPPPMEHYNYALPPPPPPPAPLPPAEQTAEQELTITPVEAEESRKELIVTEEDNLIVTEAEQLLISQTQQNEAAAAASLKRPFGALGDGAVVGEEGSEGKKIRLH